jgi:amino acid permease
MGLNFLSALTVFSFSYCCQTNAFEIYHELQDPTPKRMTRAGIWAASICTSLYIIAGIAGSADFGANVASNILNNYENPQKTPYVMAAFVAICITVTTAFPICIFPTRDAVLQVMGYATVYDTPPRVRIGVSAFLAFTALLLGLFVPNIQVMFSVLGGVCGSLLGYCLPVIFAYRAGVLTLEKSGPVRFGIGVAVCVGGGICGIVGTFTSIYSTIKGNGSSSSPSAAPFNNSTNASLNMSLF